MDKIFDISPIDLPFTDAVSSGQADNTYKEFVSERLAVADKDNADIDGADASGNDTVLGQRFGAYTQLLTKIVRVSDRGRDVRTIGNSDELIRQLMKRNKEIRRDCEAALTSHNPSVAGDSSTASKMAGVGSWIGIKLDTVAATTSERGVGGADPVLSGASGNGGTPTTAATAGTTRALTESAVRDMMKEAYLNGGDPTMAMSTPSVIEKFSSYLFTSSARIATLQSDVKQSNTTSASSGNGNSGGGVVAQGSINVMVTDFGTIELVPNRFMPQATTDNDSLYLIDPTTWEVSYLSGYRTKPLARNGLAENRQISADVTLCAMSPDGNAIVADIDADLAMTA